MALFVSGERHMNVSDFSRALSRATLIAGAQLGVSVFVWAAPADAEHGRELAALSTLQPGQWSLRGLDATSPSKTLCIGDMETLLRVANPKASCTEAVISDASDHATVYYSCPGVGHAQTSLKVETPRLVQIDSQGVRGNEPFALAYEARRAGECQAAAVAHQR